jgi:ankyrin repeat protein
VTLLLEKGADVNAQGGDYGNALYAASNRGHDSVVTLLLEKGADVNAQGVTMAMPFMQLPTEVMTLL